MVDLAVFRNIDISSHKGTYSVFFEPDLNQILNQYNNNNKTHFIIAYWKYLM